MEPVLARGNLADHGVHILLHQIAEPNVSSRPSGPLGPSSAGAVSANDDPYFSDQCCDGMGLGAPRAWLGSAGTTVNKRSTCALVPVASARLRHRAGAATVIPVRRLTTCAT